MLNTCSPSEGLGFGCAHHLTPSKNPGLSDSDKSPSGRRSRSEAGGLWHVPVSRLGKTYPAFSGLRPTRPHPFLLPLYFVCFCCDRSQPRVQLYATSYESFWASQVALEVNNLPANVGDARDTGSVPGSERSPRGGNGNPLQYSCLENPMDRISSP